MTSILCGCSRVGNSQAVVFETGYQEENDSTVSTDFTKMVQQTGDSKQEVSDVADSDIGFATVHICGAVKNPGVYTLPEGTRYEQALEAAGGVTSAGAKDYLNLADIVSDGEKIYVPFLKDVEDQYGIAAESERKQESGETDTSSSLININTATAAQLQQLKGIGQVRAEAIVEYREANGAFQTIEDIMNVPGIKDGAFQKIKDDITVG